MITGGVPVAIACCAAFAPDVDARGASRETARSLTLGALINSGMGRFQLGDARRRRGVPVATGPRARQQASQEVVAHGARAVGLLVVVIQVGRAIHFEDDAARL